MAIQVAKDARRVLEVLAKRFARYDLTLHPEKTRLVEFRPPGRQSGGRDEDTHTDRCFDMLGFTHYWARSRRGRWMVKRKTAKSRFGRAVWCRAYRHLPLAEQHEAINSKLQGHYAYYGVTGNARALSRYLRQAERTWRKWLNRRSQRARMSWEVMNRLLQRYPFPQPHISSPITIAGLADVLSEVPCSSSARSMDMSAAV